MKVITDLCVVSNRCFVSKNEKGALKKRAKQYVKTVYLRLMSAQVVVNLPAASTEATEAISSRKLC